MLLTRQTLDEIASGRISLVYRRWRKPGVRGGGTLATTIGILAIESVDAIAEDTISADDAVAAGHDSPAALLADLAGREGQLYRIRLRLAGPDPRVGLRAQADIDDAGMVSIAQRLQRLDAARAWTGATLALIARHPGRRAAELAAMLGRDMPGLKRDIRKLKALGLTESLETGYRLSPRGAAWSSRQSGDA
jgi:hypothetical protein